MLFSLENFTRNLNAMYEKAGGKGSPFIPRLADAVGVTPRTIHKLLEGAEPGLGLAAQIADHLGTDLSAMAGVEAPTLAPPREPTADELAIAMLERFGVEKEKLGIIMSVLTAGKAEMSIYIDARRAIESLPKKSVAKKNSAG